MLLFIMPYALYGQNVVDQTIKAINEGDVTELSKHFDKVVDVTLLNEQSTYSSSQATIILKKFFEKNEITSFSVKHKGSPANNASVYVIGNLESRQKKQFRLYLFFKQKADGLFLEEIRIDE